MNKKDILKRLEDWYNNDKTCSGRPHCLVDDCDLCVTCFDDLKERLMADVWIKKNIHLRKGGK